MGNMDTAYNKAEETPPSISDDPAEEVIAVALAQLGKPYKLANEGPDIFDCSGLIYYAFKETGSLLLIGGQRKRAIGYYNFFMNNGLFTPRVDLARRGDLAVYGVDRIEHIGIYLGGRKRNVVSALVNPFGVTKHRYDRITVPIIGFLEVQYPS